MERRRSAVNEVLPDRIYQRGQIFTWTREAKARMFEEHKIRSVVNFWPKIDPDLADMGLDWSWQLSCPRSEQMLLPHIEQASACVASYLRMPNTSTLILCEAGKTRSVFFCVLVVKRLQKFEYYDDAYQAVKSTVAGTSLKGFMLDYFEDQDK